MRSCRNRACQQSRLARALVVSLLFAAGNVVGSPLADTIERVTPSVVVMGTVAPLRQPQADFRGTGFVVGDGRHVLTNFHVLPNPAEMEDKERLAVFTGAGREVQGRAAEIVARDRRHDLAVLRIEGERLPALRLAQTDGVRAGERYVFTGFPIGMVLGMHPVTHEALISSITPIAIPQGRSGDLDPALIRQLDEPWDVLQLDATAYPGNSGSPLYDPATAEVIGVVNLVFVKGHKENVLKDPSGIAYAIPIRHARPLVEEVLSR